MRRAVSLKINTERPQVLQVLAGVLLSVARRRASLIPSFEGRKYLAGLGAALGSHLRAQPSHIGQLLMPLQDGLGFALQPHHLRDFLLPASKYLAYIASWIERTAWAKAANAGAIAGA